MDTSTRTQAEQSAPETQQPPADPQAQHDTDGGTWAQKQAAFIKRGEYDKVDWPSVIDAIQYPALIHKNAWQSHCKDVLADMLQIEHARSDGSEFNCWEQDIIYDRGQMSKAISNHPGMSGPELADQLAAAWAVGKRLAVDVLVCNEGQRSGLEVGPALDAVKRRRERELNELIPDECPWSLVEVAGCNPTNWESAEAPSREVWPQVVAERLNQELKRNYPTRGWYEGVCGDSVVPRHQNSREYDLNLLHGEDVGIWADDQVAAMQRRSYHEIDWDNLILEIESLAAEAPHEWEKCCTRTMEHMLKIVHWDAHDEELPDRLKHWRERILTKYRDRMHAAIRKQSGVKRQVRELWGDAWRFARADAYEKLLARHRKLLASGQVADMPDTRARGQELDGLIPEECPWTLAEVVGYNLRSEDPEAAPAVDVWPPEVAKRLNQVLGLGEDVYSEKGWVVDRNTGRVRKTKKVKPADRVVD